MKIKIGQRFEVLKDFPWGIPLRKGRIVTITYINSKEQQINFAEQPSEMRQLPNWSFLLKEFYLVFQKIAPPSLKIRKFTL